MNNLISTKELSRNEIETIISDAKEMKKAHPGPLLEGKLMASCFFEPSTRTRLSFEAAMKRLGGSVIGFSDRAVTATQKGESLYDMMKVIGLYADLVVVRHPIEGSARLVAEAANKPVINAGDGANEHPSQTLLDLMTIDECHGKIEGLHIGFVGDLHYGRTVHSLAYVLKKFKTRLYFIAPSSLSMPPSICEELKKSGVPYSFHHTLDEVMGKVDVLYMTRIQKERFTDPDEYRQVKDHFILTKEHLKYAKEGLKILHPLPRLSELPKEVDTSKHAYYFAQAENGLYMRQALLYKLLRES